jgi:hypothetical protein
LKLFHGVQTGDSGDPVVIVEFLVYETLLPGCNLVKIRCHVAKSSLTRPIILPEKGLLSVAERDPGGSTEESHVLVVAG